MPSKKHKILFITPPAKKMSGSFESFTEGGSSFPSIGLLILAALARDNGHKVTFMDFLNSGKDENAAIKNILSECPDILAISSNTDMILDAASLAEAVKKVKSDMLIITGGPHISAVPEETMKICMAFDVGFVGEAEKSFSAFLDSDFSAKAMSGIPGIIYRDAGNIILNDRQPFIQDLDSLPFPAWDLINDMRVYRPAVTNYKKEPVFSLMTSRGCFGQCVFCDRGVFGNKIRMHSTGYIMKMIRELREKFGIKEITFYDDNMVFDKKRLMDICQAILNEKESLSWSCSARVDRVDEEMLRLMKKSGCWQISYGVESGSEDVLKRLKKGITIEQIKKAMRLTRKMGMSARGYFIIGNPGETEATLKETFKLILELPMDDILVEYMTPYPGTELYDDMGKYGTMTGDWSDLNSYGINLTPHGMNRELMVEYFYKFYKAFYLRPGVIVRYVKRLKSPLKMFDLGMKYLRFSGAKES